MDPSVTDFIAREARFGARNYEPLGVVLSRGEGVFFGIRRAIATSIASPPIPR